MEIVRFHQGSEPKPRWGRLNAGRIQPLTTSAETLAELLRHRNELNASGGLEPVVPEELRLVSPVTECQIICQGKNYADHMRELGVKPSEKTFNLFFVKASSSLAPPTGDLLRPVGVELLDYELELAIVIGKPITSPVKVTAGNLHEYVAGIVMANDVSARDVQVVRGQWFHGKSFRGFCPVGPVLHLLTPGETLPDLDLELKVNGVVRQSAATSQMIYPPHETLSELSTFMNMAPGDIVLTGTPGGVALKLPPSGLRRALGLFLDEPAMGRLFLRRQRSNLNYLKSGDLIESTIRARDGLVNLGKQTLRICDA